MNFGIQLWKLLLLMSTINENEHNLVMRLYGCFVVEREIHGDPLQNMFGEWSGIANIIE